MILIYTLRYYRSVSQPAIKINLSYPFFILNIMSQTEKSYTHVNYAWNDEIANKLDPVERLVYRSNILGADQRITNTGGGNTSAKIVEKDPITGEEVEVLWVKGSGGDLRTSKKGKLFLAIPGQAALPARHI
ncbi:MAG: hypothetical protein ACFHHU_10965 [Porticoccaceae bacterium]